MRAIIGYGNSLRGEDGFGVEVIQRLQNHTIENTKLFELFQLTPELCLELLGCDHLIFIDAYSLRNHQYSLIVPISSHTDWNISHHISPWTILTLLKELYNQTPTFEIYSMATCSFDKINDQNLYFEAVDTTVRFLID